MKQIARTTFIGSIASIFRLYYLYLNLWLDSCEPQRCIANTGTLVVTRIQTVTARVVFGNHSSGHSIERWSSKRREENEVTTTIVSKPPSKRTTKSKSEPTTYSGWNSSCICASIQQNRCSRITSSSNNEVGVLLFKSWGNNNCTTAGLAVVLKQSACTTCWLSLLLKTNVIGIKIVWLLVLACRLAFRTTYPNSVLQTAWIPRQERHCSTQSGDKTKLFLPCSGQVVEVVWEIQFVSKAITIWAECEIATSQQHLNKRQLRATL